MKPLQWILIGWCLGWIVSFLIQSNWIGAGIVTIILSAAWLTWRRT